MQSGTEEDQTGNNGSCSGNNGAPQACACCTALAQLRLPWMDVAVQHAAPHYPQSPYSQSAYPQSPYPQPAYPYAHSHPAYGRNSGNGDSEPDYDEEEEEEEKTLFFKLPGFGRSKKKKNKAKKVKNTAAKPRQKKSDEKGQESSAESGDLDCQPEAGAPATDGQSTDESQNNTWHAEASPKKAKFRLAFGIQGLAVSLFGILIPGFVLVSSILSAPKRITLVALHHPVETVVEFLLVAAIPLVNYLVWTAISKNRANLSRYLVMALGAGVGTALVVSGLSFGALFGNHDDLSYAIGTDFSMGFTWLAMLSLISSVVSFYLANRLRMKWELPSTRLNITIQAVTGLVLSVLAFAACEFRPWIIRMAQYNAVSSKTAVRAEGLRWLRSINPEREMRMECSDSRAAGLPGLFFPIKQSAQHQLYFTLTGTPYSFRDEKSTDLSSMPNDYLSRHVVGDKVPHLDLTRSSLNGSLHANTLTSTLNWTFVVKNGNSYEQEMRAEIGLPAGAAVTGLTVWRKGEPENADFIASGKVADEGTTVAGGDTPAMVTDLGHGRVLLHCYPVPREEELKVRMSMVVPLKSESAGQASLVTPQLIASNFGMEGEHQLRLRSKTELSSAVKGLEISSIPGGDKVISGVMSSVQLESSPLMVTARRGIANRPFAVLDSIAVKHRLEDAKQKEIARVNRERAKEQQRLAEANQKDDIGQVVLMLDGSKGVRTQFDDLSKLLAQRKAGPKKRVIKPRVITVKPQYILEDIARVSAPAPKHLVVVVDGSQTMNGYKKEVKEALSALPASIPASVIVASQENEKSAAAKPLKSILADFDKLNFVGGQDNLRAVVRASELAGETKDSAVLWIHGPQPVINQEIYIMSPYESTPAFYELPVVAGTDTYEFFKNHAEIGPFTQVPRNGRSIANDLTDFFAKWNPHNNSFVSSLTQVEKLPANAEAPSKDEAKELVVLHAVQECNKLISTRHFRRAARLAVAYGFVSPVSAAYLSNSNATPQDADLSQPAANEDEEQDGTTASQASVKVDLNAKQTVDAFDVIGKDFRRQSAPVLQGATNGTIGPQGSDATVIMGVNTAGTVRVNNLANLEALLNIIANLGELGALISGLCLVVHGFMNKSVIQFGEDVELGPGGRIAIGAILCVMGLSLPGIINWFVASARDANLFS